MYSGGPLMKVTTPALGQIMPPLVFKEHHLWLNMAEMKEADEVRFREGPISQASLFADTVENFAQQTEVIRHILPRCDDAATRPPRAAPLPARR